MFTEQFPQFVETESERGHRVRAPSVAMFEAELDTAGMPPMEDIDFYVVDPGFSTAYATDSRNIALGETWNDTVVRATALLVPFAPPRGGTNAWSVGRLASGRNAKTIIQQSPHLKYERRRLRTTLIPDDHRHSLANKPVVPSEEGEVLIQAFRAARYKKNKGDPDLAYEDAEDPSGEEVRHQFEVTYFPTTPLEVPVEDITLQYISDHYYGYTAPPRVPRHAKENSVLKRALRDCPGQFKEIYQVDVPDEWKHARGYLEQRFPGWDYYELDRLENLVFGWDARTYLETAMDTGLPDYECPWAHDVVTTTRTWLEDHLRGCPEKRPEYTRCVVCEERFPKNKMGQHTSTHLMAEYECPLCDFEVPVGVLTMHLLYAHDTRLAEVPNIKCPYCEDERFRFPSMEQLLAHAIGSHEDELDMDPPITHATEYTTSRLAEGDTELKYDLTGRLLEAIEMSVEAGEEEGEYVCEFCGLVFDQHDELGRHVADEHAPETEYLCEYCGYSDFDHAQQYGGHVSVHARRGHEKLDDPTAVENPTEDPLPPDESEPEPEPEPEPEQVDETPPSEARYEMMDDPETEPPAEPEEEPTRVVDTQVVDRAVPTGLRELDYDQRAQVAQLLAHVGTGAEVLSALARALDDVDEATFDEALEQANDIEDRELRLALLRFILDHE